VRGSAVKGLGWSECKERRAALKSTEIMKLQRAASTADMFVDTAASRVRNRVFVETDDKSQISSQDRKMRVVNRKHPENTNLCRSETDGLRYVVFTRGERLSSFRNANDINKMRKK